MEEVKHTKGPLYAIHHGTSYRHEVRKDYGDTSHRLATLDDYAEAEADAALFAAAPELLEALQGLLSEAHGASKSLHEYSEWSIKARAAIAKATSPT